MSFRPFGKVTPAQIHMLQLAGYVVLWEEWKIRPAESDEEFRETMRLGRRDLYRLTGQDFAYKLSAWRKFLRSASDDFGYRHPYAFTQTDDAVRRAMRSRRWRRLVTPSGALAPLAQVAAGAAETGS